MSHLAELGAEHFDDLHQYDEDITVNDADMNFYTQQTCACGVGLGTHLSMEAHRAQALEEYVCARVEAAASQHAATLQRLTIMVAGELELHDSPLHIQANLDQIITEGWASLGLPDPRPTESNTFPAPGPGSITL